MATVKTVIGSAVASSSQFNDQAKPHAGGQHHELNQGGLLGQR
jgi:hypothetical protein